MLFHNAVLKLISQLHLFELISNFKLNKEHKYVGFQTCTDAEGECDASLGLFCQGNDESKQCL